MQSLATLRKQIDTIDTDLIKLLEARFKACLEIGAIKSKAGSPVLDTAREKIIYDKLTPSHYHAQLEDVFNRIMHHCKVLQRNAA